MIDADAIADFNDKQLRGSALEPHNDTLATSSTRSLLEGMRFAANCRDIDVADIEAAKQHPKVCGENHFAAAAANFAHTTIGCRFSRMAPDLIGWPNRGVGWGSICQAVRAETTQAFKADLEIHEDMELAASGGFWDEVKNAAACSEPFL